MRKAGRQAVMSVASVGKAFGMCLTTAMVATAPVAAMQPTDDDPIAPPSRVLIIVLDQTRPDTIDRYGMANVQALRDGGVRFPNAYVGHMSSNTVISHNVITSGQFPRNMGWSNEVYRDVDNRLGGGAGAYYVTSSMSCGQYGTLITAEGYPKLEDYLGRKFVAIAEKTTAACTAGHPADADDIIIRMSRALFDCDGNGSLESNLRFPSGANVPTYISQPQCGRFYVDATPRYGTDTTPPAWLYPADGNRFFPGFDPAHFGGDIWVADAAIAVMENEPDWRGMLLSFGAIDKSGHMWGPEDAVTGTPGSEEEMTHLPFVARTADEQVGRVLDKLEELGIRDETLIVVTADHAAQTAHRFHGEDGPFRSDFNWYYGQDADETYLDPSPAIQTLVDGLGGNLDFSYQDTHIAAWLQVNSLDRKREAADVLRTLPDVIATYYLNEAEDRYMLRWKSNDIRGSERAWFAQHSRELVNTMASPDNGDAVALLRNDTAYSVFGEHGGHQRQVQRIPIIFNWSGLHGGQKLGHHMRHVDILPTVLRLLGIPQDPAHPLEGRAISLPLEH